MRKLLLCAVIAAIAVIGGAAIAIAAGSDPVVGTWQLNTSKSKFSAGPAMQSQTRTYSQSGEKITLVMTTVGPDGKEVTTHTTYLLNGKDFPVTGTPDYDSLSAKRIDSNKAQFTLKKAGKEIGTTSRTVSKDGKTLTATTNVTTAAGEKSENVLVFDRK
jgi:septin family protein